MIDVKVKCIINDVELSVKTTVESDDKAKTKLKELYDLLKESETDIFPVDASNVPKPFIIGAGI